MKENDPKSDFSLGNSEILSGCIAVGVIKCDAAKCLRLSQLLRIIHLGIPDGAKSPSVLKSRQ